MSIRWFINAFQRPNLIGYNSAMTSRMLCIIAAAVVAGSLGSACTTTPCGAGHREAVNDREGALITYCVSRDGRADGAYSCRLHGKRGAVVGQFNLNDEHGDWYFYGANDELVRIETWKDGVLLATDTKLTDDQPHLRCDAYDIYPKKIELPDLDVGWSQQGDVSVRWYPETEPPQRWQAGRYADGLKQGEWGYWYPTGAKRGSGSFERGLAHGRWVMWNHQGKKLARGTYAHGRLVGGTDVVPAITGAAALNDPECYLLTVEEVRNQLLHR